MSWLLARFAGLLGGPQPLGSAPYEELLRRYANEPEDVFRELVRRLQPIVLLAAEEYARRNRIANVKDDAVDRSKKVFASFAAVITSGEPEHGLRRLAGSIRQVLDEESFAAVAQAFYTHVPLYHMRNVDQRRCIEAMLASGGRATAGDIAAQLMLREADVDALIEAGNKKLQRIISKDFNVDELKTMTEDELP